MTIQTTHTALSKIELIAVIVAVTDGQPKVITVGPEQKLPSGPLESDHKSLQSTIRDWVKTRTDYPVDFLEQLYTFTNRDRLSSDEYPNTLSVSYLGLVREHERILPKVEWHNWYEHFPWDDCRNGKHPCVDEIIAALYQWADKDKTNCEFKKRRISFLFGCDGFSWNEDFILQRYELLYEAGLIAEAGGTLYAGTPMFADDRRILATAIARLRRKIKYRAVIFELLPEKFTLLQLQKTVEAIIGRRLHKPNFRRLTEHQGIIEEVGERETQTGGRPAKLYRYKQEVIESCVITLSRFPIARS
ncbi:MULTISPECIES: hypothetical protein [Bartonella]|uniref:NUDIX hydrolase n=1 Tax=Bartonella TaxID=773 RepID=UPI0018DC4783|nr:MULTISPECIES: hypothetical protein [Bartonella]MBH9974208.1 hypothetical protein [Bartonella choladocola]MBI0013815.1 hypothetical protein [Bartonella sp. B10834G3]